MSLLNKHSNRQNKIKQNDFLFIKNKLDHYMLPTNFPLESASLLLKLLEKLDEKSKLNCQQHLERENIVHKEQKLIDLAIKNEMSKLVNENNKLHLQVITLKEQIAALRQKFSKFEIKQNKQLKQSELLNRIQMNQQIQLKQQNNQLKYKCNQLIDFIHDDSNKQKQYLKNLLKHKHIDQKVSQDVRTRGISDNGIKKQTKQGQSNYKDQIKIMKFKIQNRQKQIQRLQQKLQFDGTNLNKIIFNFEKDRQMSKYQNQQQNMLFLLQQNKTMKEEIDKIKREGGDKQALRQQSQKNKSAIKKLQQQNMRIKSKSKQIKFDQQKQRKCLQNKLNRTTKQINNIVEQNSEQKKFNIHNKQKINHLQQKIQDLQTSLRKQQQKYLKKQIQLSILSKKIQGEKLMNQYEYQKLKQSQSQSRSALIQLQKKYLDLQIKKKSHNKQIQLKTMSIINLETIMQQLIRQRKDAQESTTMLDRTIIQANLDAVKRQNSDLKISIRKIQNQYLNLQAVNNCTIINYKNLQKQYKNICLLNQQTKRQNQLLQQQNNNLNIKIFEYLKLQQKLQNQKKQKEVTFCLYQKQREVNIKVNAQITQLQINQQKALKEISLYKNQLNSILQNEKNRQKELQKKIALLEQNFLIKSHSLQEKQARIGTLEKDLIQHSLRIRQINKQASILDEELHKLKIEKTRLQRKNSQLSSDLNLIRQKQHKKISLSEIQYKSQIQRLWRQKQNIKILVKELQKENNSLLEIKRQVQLQNGQIKQKIQILSLKQEDMKNKEKLYVMEIKELKKMLQQQKID